MKGAYNNIVVASVALTALRTLPVLVPDVRAQRHIGTAKFRTLILRRAPLRYVVLFQSALLPVRRAAPTDLRQAHILAVVARLYRCHAFAFVVLLSIAHVTLQRNACRPLQHYQFLKIFYKNFDIFPTNGKIDPVGWAL